MKSLLFLITLLVANSIYSQDTLKDLPQHKTEINKTNSRGQKQGIWITYDQYGRILYLKEFVDDILHGYFENYLLNGKISEKGYYKNGKLDSLLIGYWSDGKIRAEAFYKDGLLHGVSTTYNQDGELTSRKKYINGKEDSTYSDAFFDETIILDSQAIYIDTIITINEFSDFNKVIAIYVNDTLTKEIKFYKDQPAIENFFEHALLTKRIVYSLKKPYYIEKIFYYRDEKLIKTEYYDKKGNLIKKN